MIPSLPSFTPCKGIQDSLELWIPRRGFRIVCQWNLDSEFQSLVGFPFPWAVTRTQKHRMPDSTGSLTWGNWMFPNLTTFTPLSNIPPYTMKSTKSWSYCWLCWTSLEDTEKLWKEKTLIYCDDAMRWLCQPTVDPLATDFSVAQW